MSGIMPYAGLISFLRAPESLKNGMPQVVILGIPTDFGASYRPGARFGPRAIREASMQYAYDPVEEGLFDIELNRTILKGLRIEDHGDVPLEPAATQENFTAIEETARDLFRENVLPVFLGGDHSITFPILKGLSDPSVFLVHLDAHADFDSTFESPFTHGSVMRRVRENGLVSGMVQVGLRGLLSDRKDAEEAKDLGVRQFTALQIEEDGIEPILEMVPGDRAVYLSLDIDVFDPSIAPGTGTPEPGGLSYRQVNRLIHGIIERACFIGMDIVEINPYHDPAGITALLAARVIINTLGSLGCEKNGK